MRFSTALGVSIAFHAVLAAGIGFYLTRAPSGTVLAELDLSSVELSIAEEESEAAPAAILPPRASAVPPPPEAAPPPASDLEALPTPPDPAAMKLPEPKDAAPPKMDLPEELPRARTPEVKESAQKPPAEPKAETPPGVADASAAAAPRQAQVEAPPTLKKAIRPDYPRGARARGEEGDVALEVAVDEQGGVTAVKVVTASPFADLNAAAVKAVRKAHFTPARQGERNIGCTVRLTLAFRLRN